MSTKTSQREAAPAGPQSPAEMLGLHREEIESQLAACGELASIRADFAGFEPTGDNLADSDRLRELAVRITDAGEHLLYAACKAAVAIEDIADAFCARAEDNDEDQDD